MTVSGRSDLETLLRAHQLDRTLVSASSLVGSRDEAVAPTGVPALDALLGGGLPRGQLSELVGPRSSGRTGALCTLLASATTRGELAALVDTADTFDPTSAVAAGIELSRLLWIRGTYVSARSTGELVTRVLDRAIKALGLVLHAGGFGVVALDLAAVPALAVRRLPFTTWMRLARALEGGRTACVVVGSEPVACSARGVTVVLQPVSPAGRWSGQSPRARLLRGLEARARLRSARVAACDEEGVRLTLNIWEGALTIED